MSDEQRIIDQAALAERFTFWCTDHGTHSHDVADRLHIPRRTLSLWLLGRGSLTDDQVQKITALMDRA